MLQFKVGMKEMDAIMKTGICYILANSPNIVLDITVINHVNMGSDHRIVMSSITLDMEVTQHKWRRTRHYQEGG